MAAFLFGKLPAFGDFVSRGLSPPARSWWDRWCSDAVLDARARFGDDFDRHYRATEARRFLIAPRAPGGAWHTGCLTPSVDRAGRAFPFVLGVTVPTSTDAADVGGRLALCIVRALERDIDLDALIASADIMAADPAGATQSLREIAAGDIGWIGRVPIGAEG